MKRFLTLHEAFRDINQRKISVWLDKLTFTRILLLWIILIALFGIAYHFFENNDANLLYSADKTMVQKLTDTIYFSFVASTTTGFGDIIPNGWFKIISTIEVICGLLLLALVTSKLISIKQDV